MGEVPPPLRFRPKNPSTPALELVYSGVYPQFCHLSTGTCAKDFSFYFKKYGTCAYNSGKQNLACPELALEMIAEKILFLGIWRRNDAVFSSQNCQRCWGSFPEACMDLILLLHSWILTGHQKKPSVGRSQDDSPSPCPLCSMLRFWTPMPGDIPCRRKDATLASSPHYKAHPEGP